MESIEYLKKEVARLSLQSDKQLMLIEHLISDNKIERCEYEELKCNLRVTSKAIYNNILNKYRSIILFFLGLCYFSLLFLCISYLKISTEFIIMVTLIFCFLSMVLIHCILSFYSYLMATINKKSFLALRNIFSKILYFSIVGVLIHIVCILNFVFIVKAVMKSEVLDNIYYIMPLTIFWGIPSAIFSINKLKSILIKEHRKWEELRLSDPEIVPFYFFLTLYSVSLFICLIRVLRIEQDVHSLFSLIIIIATPVVILTLCNIWIIILYDKRMYDKFCTKYSLILELLPIKSQPGYS